MEIEKNYSFLKYLIDEDIYVVNKNKINENLKLRTVSKNTIKQNERNIVYSGDNLKKLAVIVDSSNRLIKDDSNLDFLKKILFSIGYEINDIALIGMQENSNLSLNSLNTISLKNILIFDKDTSLISIDKYIIKDFEGIKIISCDSLDEISLQIEKKKLLWITLKQCFL